MSGHVQTNQAIMLPTPVAAASYNLNAADTGKLILIPVLGGAGANDLTINLPAVAAGLHYRFMATGTLASDAILTPTNGLPPYTPIVGLINGVLINNNAQVAVTVVPKAAVNTASMLAVAEVGTYIDAFCDGTNWHVSGLSKIAAGLA